MAFLFKIDIMKLQLSTSENISKIMQIIDDAKELLASLKIDQWQNGYPNEAKSLQMLSRSPSGSGSRRRRYNLRIRWHKDTSRASHWDPIGPTGSQVGA